jgi:hypothetical protein
LIYAATTLTVLLMLTSCGPSSRTTPTLEPAFSSEEEAFEAAEATYVLYTNASNARRSGDPTAHPEDYLIGTALEADLAASDYLRSQGLTITGTAEILEFRGLDADVDAKGTSLTALVCLDSSGTRVLDSTGADVTPVERETIIALTARMISDDDAFRIEDELEVEATEC